MGITDEIEQTSAWRALVAGSASLTADPPLCQCCDGTGRVTYWPAGVSQYQHPGYTSPCGDCGGTGYEETEE